MWIIFDTVNREVESYPMSSLKRCSDEAARLNVACGAVRYEAIRCDVARQLVTVVVGLVPDLANDGETYLC